MTFSMYLSDALACSGMTQEQLAGRVFRMNSRGDTVRPVTVRTLQNWLNGSSAPTSRLTYISLGLALGLDYESISAMVRRYTGRDLFVRTTDDIPLSAVALRLCPCEEFPAFREELARIAADSKPSEAELDAFAGEGPTRELQLAFSACRSRADFLACFRQSLPCILAGVRRLADELEAVYASHHPDGAPLDVYLENRLHFLKSNYEKLRSGRFDGGTALLTARLCLFLGFSVDEIDRVLCAGHYAPLAGTPMGALLAQATGASPHEVWTALERLSAGVEELPAPLTVKYLPCAGLDTAERGLSALLFGLALLHGRRRPGADEPFYTCLGNLDTLLLGCLSGQHIHRHLQALRRALPTVCGLPPDRAYTTPDQFVRTAAPALLAYAPEHGLGELIRPVFGLPLSHFAGDFRAEALAQAGTLRGPLPGSDRCCLPPDWLPEGVSLSDRARLAEEYFFAALLYSLFFGSIYRGQTVFPIPEGLSPSERHLYGLVVKYCRAHLLPEKPLYIRPVYGTAVRKDMDGAPARMDYLLTELLDALLCL